ncbi:MAG TPA: hypothetical protein PK079_04890 [Leptospiraceae bacterium]|nr:hypothetical protein [Leptospiraceae bacterium]HMW04995.1 hypothetical protein [Leptospiraceae bacterium]HMX35099.1 hypothetical protein [Leptospiraceae bacterium]HMY30784.1 hypothetical protein [Leptospiraceae bacterium]HMZ66365.1 hypothetical protein [Leptospiraceae bacterium]
MIQGNKNSLNKSMMALILHTLEESEKEAIEPEQGNESSKQKENNPSPIANEKFSFIKIE